MMIDHEKNRKISLENSIRIEKIYYLSMFSDEVPYSFIEEINNGLLTAEDIFGDNNIDLFDFFGQKSYGDLKNILIKEIDKRERYGFLVLVSEAYLKEKDDIFEKWSTFRTKWFYAESVQEAIDKATKYFSE